MHERKKAFTDLSDGFLTLPGGVGTMDELWEAVSWAQLGYHAKPVGLLNAFGFYDGLIAFNRHMGEIGFIRAEHRGHPDRRGRARPAARADGGLRAAQADLPDEGGRAVMAIQRFRDRRPRLLAPSRILRPTAAPDRRRARARGAGRGGAARRSPGAARASPSPAGCSTATRASAPGCSTPGAAAATTSPTGRTSAASSATRRTPRTASRRSAC